MATMLGALNRFMSRLDSEPQTSSSAAYGFHVLKNTRAELAIEPWYDFIIGINGRNIDTSDENLFAEEVRNCAGRNMSLGVYSTKGQQIREIQLPVPADSASLGLTLQWAPLTATEDVWHILQVTPNSPADSAGLIPYSDYVVGSPEGLMHGDGGLAELVEDFMNRALRLYVYNNEFDVTRMVEITPSRAWGGDGALGCVLGFGALHRVPAPLTEPMQAPGEALFDTAASAQPSPAMLNGTFVSRPVSPARRDPALFVPANMINTPVAASQPDRVKQTGRKKTDRTAATADFDEYFKEGEETSKALDRGSTPKSAAPHSLPPPPSKAASASGPPKPAQSTSDDANPVLEAAA